MKIGPSIFRILLRAFGLGLAAVFMWQGMSIAWGDVAIDLPKAQSGNVLEVTVSIAKRPPESRYFCDELVDQNERASCLHQLTFEGRDLELYDDGGLQGCGLERRSADQSGCERSIEKARRFVWEHWKKRKRGYVAVAQASDKAEWVTHLFIEPTPDGSWRVDERTLPMLVEPADPDHYGLDDLIEIKWERATSEDVRFGLTPGAMYLRLSSMTGDSLVL